MLLGQASVKGGPEILMPEGREEKLNAPPHKCPRCDSANTKFCYYNNYSRSQPRHFCRACRRYWTQGGALRNVPVGGIRKNKRLKIAPVAIAAGGNPATAISLTAAGELDGAVFPDISCHQVFRSPPAQPDSPSAYSIEGYFDAPPPHTSLMFMEDSDFGGASLGFIWSGGIAAVSSSSCFSSPSSHYSCRSHDVGGGGSEEGLLGMMDAPRGGTWVKEETALPASYWDF